MYLWQGHLQNWFGYTRFFTPLKLIREKISRFARWNKKGNLYLTWLFTLLISINWTEQTTFEYLNAFFQIVSRVDKMLRENVAQKIQILRVVPG